MIEVPTDLDNVIPFVAPKPPKDMVRTTGGHHIMCTHRHGIDLEPSTRAVTCRKCGATVDPVDALLHMAEWFRWERSKIDLARREAERLNGGIKEAEARLKRLKSAANGRERRGLALMSVEQATALVRAQKNAKIAAGHLRRIAGDLPKGPMTERIETATGGVTHIQCSRETGPRADLDRVAWHLDHLFRDLSKVVTIAEKVIADAKPADGHDAEGHEEAP